MVTEDLARKKLIERLQTDLRKKCVHLSPDTIELVLDCYDKRLAKEVKQVKGTYSPYDTHFIHNLTKGM